MKKIMIFGKPGSGKSTLALQIHRSSGIPVFHLDRYFFTKNWAERDYQDFLEDQKNIVAKDEWIIDGNSVQSLELRYQNSELVIYLNYPKLTCYLRLLKRMFGKKNSALKQAGWSNKISWSLLSYTWSFEQRVASKIKQMKSKYPHIRFIEINHDQALKNLQAQISSKN